MDSNAPWELLYPAGLTPPCIADRGEQAVEVLVPQPARGQVTTASMGAPLSTIATKTWRCRGGEHLIGRVANRVG
jgi:hypothetical protein